MLAEYTFYHGALLHEVVLSCRKPIKIEPCDSYGRPNSYLLNEVVGAFIKHSTKRLSPWVFTFTKEHLIEVQSLCQRAKSVYGCFICGDDGIACVPVADFVNILGSAESDQAWLRFDRRSKEMYRISGAKGNLSYKLARGVDIMAREIERPLAETISTEPADSQIVP